MEPKNVQYKWVYNQNYVFLLYRHENLYSYLNKYLFTYLYSM
jgi:hypothetical protein